MNALTKTAEALKVWKKQCIARDLLWDKVASAEDIYALDADEKECWKVVLTSFHSDTKEYNSLEKCMMLRVSDLPFLSRLV